MKKTIYTLLGLIIFATINPLAALAQESEDLCSQYSTAKDGFFVLLEEPMGQTDGKNSAICMRKCDKETTKGKRVCKIVAVGSCKQTDDTTCQRVQIIKADSGANLLYTYIGMIYKWAAGTIGIIAVLTMVYSGVLIIASNGDSAAIDSAKERIGKSIAGLVVLFLSGLILYTINPTFFV